MSWVDVKIPPRPKNIPRVTFAIRADSTFGSRLGISATLIDQLKWDKNTSLRLMAGHQEHAAMVRLEPTPDGQIRVAIVRHGARIWLGKPSCFKNVDLEKTRVEYQILGRSLQFVVPAHVWVRPVATAA